MVEKQNFFKHYKDELIAFVLYLPVTILLTFPVAFRIGSAIPGLGADSFQWMRILWYTKVSLSGPDLGALTHDSLLFYPDGITNMAFPSAFNQIIYLFLSPYLELPVIYTLLWLLTFFLSSFGCYLLVKYLTGNSYAAFISGIIFAFSPYHLSRGLYFFGATTIQWIPFCALYLMKMFKYGNIINSIVAGIFFILVGMSDPQNMIFLGIFVMLLFIYEHYLIFSTWTNFNTILEQLHDSLKKYTIFGIVAFSGILPLMINDIQIAISKENFLKPDIGQISTLSNDLVSFFIPSHLHPLFGKYVLDIYSNIPSWLPEKANYIGYTVLFLSLYVFFKLRTNKEVKFWLIASFLFSLISLGPLLHINGETVFTLFNTTFSFPLPYPLLYNVIPFLDNCRTVGRFFVIATLAFSVLAGYGIAHILKSQKDRKVAALTVILISSLIIISYLSIPYPTTTIPKPEFYTNISLDTEHYALLEIPATNNAGNLGFDKIYYQTIHGKAIVGGYAARYPSNVHDFQKNTPFIRELSYLNSFDDILIQDTPYIGVSILNYYNIKYIVVHPSQLSQKDADFTSKLLKSTIKTDPIIYNNDSIIVYRVPDEPIIPFMILGSGWSDLKIRNRVPTRWMNDNATFFIYSNKEYLSDLSFDTFSYQQPRMLEISIDKSQKIQKAVTTSHLTITVPIPLHYGMNIVNLHTQGGCESPGDTSQFLNNYPSCLSIAIQNVRSA